MRGLKGPGSRHSWPGYTRTPSTYNNDTWIQGPVGPVGPQGPAQRSHAVTPFVGQTVSVTSEFYRAVLISCYSYI